MLISLFSAPNVPNLKALTSKNGFRNDQNAKISNWISMRIFDELQDPLPVSWIRHTRWIISEILKLIRQVVTPVQSQMLTDGRRDGRMSLSMNKPTTWCKSGRVSLVSSSRLYKTQPERALAQVCHTRIDALSPDEYQFRLDGRTDHMRHTIIRPTFVGRIKT